jgi:hypothetical protein
MYARLLPRQSRGPCENFILLASENDGKDINYSLNNLAIILRESNGSIAQPSLRNELLWTGKVGL